MDYKEKYLLMTEKYLRDIKLLHDALTDLYNSTCGMPKSCGHEFECVCQHNKAKELIDLFGEK